MADPTTVTNRKTTFDADSNPDYVVWTDEITDGGTQQKKQLVGLVSATADNVERIGGTALEGLDVDVTRLPTSNLNAAAQVTVTNVSTQLCVALLTRKGLTLRSLSTNTQSIFFGPGPVTTTTGMELKPGETATFFPGEVPINIVHGIAPSGSQVIIVQDSS